MKVSLNTIKQYTSVDVSVDVLVEKINQQIGGVEEVVDLGLKYKDALIAKIVTCEKHPNADRLSLCEIDAGPNETIQVVCGAPNAREGIFVVWLPPGSTVPSSFADKEPFVLDARELRGVVSHGMLASPKELALGDSHDGILEIDPDEWSPNQADIRPGANFAKVFGLDDHIIEIENKMFTHRPDCFGQLGVAREIAGIQHKQFVSPDWYCGLPQFKNGEGLELRVQNDASDAVPRFMAVAISGVTIKSSPLWLQVELIRLGSKPINNVVDITNYVMLLTGQPLHAYDYDKLAGGVLGARKASSSEKLSLLNGKTYELSDEDVVIVDGNGPVGLGGVMGGGESEVSHETKNIVLECATFDMYTVRRTSMRHGLFTEAVTRFNKGQSPLQNPYVLNLAMMYIFDTAGGSQASQVFDDSSHPVESSTAFITPDYVNARLGLTLDDNAIKSLLSNVEFEICDQCDDTAHADGGIHYSAPFWRTDIEIPEDIVEEVGRLYGFDKLPRELPKRNLTPVAKNPRRELKRLVRESFARGGANEVLTYSFVHEKTLRKAGQDPKEAFALKNALSPDLQYYRLSVLPSLLDKVHANIKSGHDEFALYEIGKGHNLKYHASDDNGLPKEIEFIDAVYSSKKQQVGAPYYRILRVAMQLFSDLGIDCELKPADPAMQFAVTAPFDLERSAMIFVRDTDTFLGLVGELKPAVISGFKLSSYSAAMSLDLEGLLSVYSERVVYTPLGKYPGTWRDICFKVSEQINFGQLFSAIKSASSTDIGVSISPIDTYRGDNTTDRQLTFRINLVDYEQTISAEKTNQVIDQIIKKAQQDCGAVVV